MSRGACARLVLWLTGLWFAVEALSLRLGLLDRFFFDTSHADVQGIDYFSLPKAWLNLAAGRSLYGTFDPPAYGPHVTWYLAHPVLALVLGWPLSRLTPMDSYGVFTLFSVGLFAACAALFRRQSADVLHRALLPGLFLGAFPTYLTLWVGNVQPLLVFGLTLLLVALLRMARGEESFQGLLLAGLLVSLFTKPVVLVLLPMLLLLRETRRPTAKALLVYAPVSLLCLVVPVLNPEAIGLGRVAWLAVHPGFVQRTMDIYGNGFGLTPAMRDNSIHWLNLVAQSGFRLQHVDVYSLPVFVDGLLAARTPAWLYVLPTMAVVGFSVAVPRLESPQLRRGGALLLVMAGSLSFFLVYPTVWEYQYTAVLPVAAVLLLWHDPALLPAVWRRAGLALAACAWLPSLYFLQPSASPGRAALALIRLDRVVPVLLLFLLLVGLVVRALRTVTHDRTSPRTAV